MFLILWKDLRDFEKFERICAADFYFLIIKVFLSLKNVQINFFDLFLDLCCTIASEFRHHKTMTKNSTNYDNK